MMLIFLVYISEPEASAKICVYVFILMRVFIQIYFWILFTRSEELWLFPLNTHESHHEDYLKTENNNNNNKKKKTRDQNFPAVASKPFQESEVQFKRKKKNLKINKTGVTRFAYDSSSLLFALWWVLLWPIQICKTFLLLFCFLFLSWEHPRHMASKSLCCSAILLVSKCDIIHRTSVNTRESVHTCSVYTDGGEI